MNTMQDKERAEDLERRIRCYEELEAEVQWPGAMSAADYLAALLLTVGLVVTCYLWGV
ncbi:hypothetical protein [Pseudogulbenkiania sp. MAI-1]|uniref:hypothetical protein n=1 Tax=Pseudogulbenkiania sp. MAI-1 TaxID=990370 RepID=UPI0004BA1529|nr:hypothetical protein [Pseudogulbenkiania sp. MAI-1]